MFKVKKTKKEYQTNLLAFMYSCIESNIYILS